MKLFKNDLHYQKLHCYEARSSVVFLLYVAALIPHYISYHVEYVLWCLPHSETFSWAATVSCLYLQDTVVPAS